MTAPGPVTHLLEQLRREREALRTHLDGLSHESLEEPLEPGGWTAKDLLAHLEFWDRRTLEAMRLTAADRAHDVREPATDAETDEWNHKVYEERRGWSVAEALERLQATRQELERELAALPAGLLDTPAGERRRPLRDLIAVDTYEHDREHALQLARWRAARLS